MTIPELVNYIKARIFQNGARNIKGAQCQEAVLAVVDHFDNNKLDKYNRPDATITLNRDIGSYQNNVASVTGIIKIRLPFSWTSGMMHIEIDVYEYNSNGASKIIIGGYNYAATSGWVNTSVQIIGTMPKAVRLAHDGIGCCILLGTVTDTWSYPQVAVTKLMNGFAAPVISQSRCVFNILTTETGLTSIVTPTRKVTPLTAMTNLIGAVSDGSYWGMAAPDGNTNVYVRAPQIGLLPYQSGGNGTIGTASWPFLTGYINNLYGKLNGDATGQSGASLKLNQTDQNLNPPTTLHQFWYFNANALAGAPDATNWYHYLTMTHGNAAGYHAQLAFPLSASSDSIRPKFRNKVNGTQNAWKDLAYLSDVTAKNSLATQLLTSAQLDNVATIGANTLLPFRLENQTWNGLSGVWGNGFWIKDIQDDRHTQELHVYHINGVFVQRKFYRSRTSTTAWSAWIEIPKIGTGATDAAAGNHSHNGIYEPAFTVLPISKGGTGNSTGNAATVAGLAVNSTGRNKVANQIARTDGNGYFQAGYINTDTSQENQATSSVFFEQGNDGYIRKKSLPNFKAELGSMPPAAHNHPQLVGTNYTGGGGINPPTWFRDNLGTGLTYRMMSKDISGNFGAAYNDCIFVNAYESDVTGSAMLIFSKSGAGRIGFGYAANKDAASWTIREIYHTGNKPTTTDVGAEPVFDIIEGRSF